MAIIASLVETCKLNAIDPLAYLTNTLTAIVSGHKQNRIDELLPWAYPILSSSVSAEGAAGAACRLRAASIIHDRPKAQASVFTQKRIQLKLHAADI